MGGHSLHRHSESDVNHAQTALGGISGLTTILEPMLASLADPPLMDPRLVYEPKYDGIRAIAQVAPTGDVHLWSRLGNEKTRQFPEIAAALGAWARKRKVTAVIDGEIVALDARGNPAGFQNLQGRIHLTMGSRSRTSTSSTPSASSSVPTAYMAFDLLGEGTEDLRERPLIARRARLERLFRSTGASMLRLSEQVRGDGRDLYDRALKSGWEGLIVKVADSAYRSGKRTPDWRKLKIVLEQEFVVGGWTEPRQTRTNFGALLLGVHRGPDLIYVGHVGTGFNERELARLMALLKEREIKACPFREPPVSNERPHWVRPELVAQVRFTEWTADHKLRHPVYLGLRDDKKAADVTREQTSQPRRQSAVRATTPRSRTPKAAADDGAAAVVRQLQSLEDARRDGIIELPGGERLKVTNLSKVFWPKLKITKGELLRYYAGISSLILPVVDDRPLVMKRFPNGIAGQPFYQHRTSDPTPAGVRVAMIEAAEKRAQLAGGNLITLLYMTQLAAISQDPWFSRVQTPHFVDHVALDLDPMPDVPFPKVLEVALWIRDELQTIGAAAYAKTSGSDGVHVYIPMPPETPYEAGLLFCQIVATVVANKHPKQATVERTVRARGARVYVDYLQNILGKTLASAYSVRASEYAGVSTPLTWNEVEQGVRREDFTLRSAPARFKQVGNLWSGLLEDKGVDLSRVSRLAERSQSRDLERAAKTPRRKKA
jgi:bifunctional non-homologous end joining protein LigD